MFFFIVSRQTIRAFRVASGYRKSRNPELARNKLSYLREKSRASAVCIVSRSEAARRSRRIKSERRNGQGTEDRTSSVRSFARLLVHSLVLVLFVRCDSVLSSGVHTSALECLLLAGTCERRDVSARTHTRTET